ncbi:site-specific DNA-methyltransferase [Crenothrix sp.]|uniref:site-specific DNA-methyltransferase n=1 Tax=Crenothrix sp. TaxID=3100433 RepID=UPI00374D89E4
MSKQKLELTWIGKEKRPRLEPRILLEDKEKSYHAKHRVTDNDSFDNRLIFGDNLLALKALEQNYTGKVKCVFIDPPYNTGSAFTHYDDGLEHSIWLGLMRDRLEIIHTLLADDGSLWITIDDNEAHYLKVLCDELFGRSNFVATIIWEKRTTRENRRVFSFKHDFVLVYAKQKTIFDFIRNPLPLNDTVLDRYKNPDNDPRGSWQSISANAQAGHATASQFYTLIAPNGKEHNPPKGTCWRYTKLRIEEEISNGNIWFGKDGNGVPRIKKFLRDSEDSGLTPETIWYAADVGTNDEAKKAALTHQHDEAVFDSPKPERLLNRILHIATNPNDLVLDSFAGSGTTGAVAHKMGRRWIMIELGEHCHTHIIPRLQKVIDGTDQGGISKTMNWQGGGGFRYYKLAPSLLEQDRWGQWVINKAYHAEMLAEAVCKNQGFTYAPSDSQWWKHGYSSENDFVYVTTQNLSPQQLQDLSDDVGDCSLLVCCSAFRGKADQFPNLTLKKIPKMLLHSCEWGHDDYSLNVANLPMAQPSELKPIETKKRKDNGTLDLFGDDL